MKYKHQTALDHKVKLGVYEVKENKYYKAFSPFKCKMITRVRQVQLYKIQFAKISFAELYLANIWKAGKQPSS